MLPIPMDEFMQENFKAVGMDIDFDVVEWGAMLVAIRAPDRSAGAWRRRGEYQFKLSDPSSMFRYYASIVFPPTNFNWGHWSKQASDRPVEEGAATFDPAEQ